MKRNIIKSFLFAVFLLVSGMVIATEKPAERIYTQDQPFVQVTTNDAEFTIKLPSNPTTGYSWFLTNYDNDLVQLVHHQFVAPKQSAKSLVGAPGEEVWIFRAKPEAFIGPQQTTIRFVYARPWAKQKQTKEVV